METFIAILHIVGAAITTLAIGTALFLFRAWIADRGVKHELEEAALSLGVSVKDLDEPTLLPKIIQYSSSKFSNELFRNRISDLLGITMTIFAWLIIAIQIVLLASIAWFTFTEHLENAIYAWSIVAIELFATLLFWVVAFICKILTGRQPGQARQARKSLANAINSSPA